MGRHTEWRKIAKRERRRRIRKQQATERDGTSESNGLQEQENQELLLEYEHNEILNAIENEKWIQAEKVAIVQWQILQDKIEKHNKEKLEQEAKLKLEWELEQKKRQIEEERLEELKEENMRKQRIFMEHLEKFLSGDSEDPPAELLTMRESKPNSPLCPFFSKTACCRFGDQCSRNHQFPSISKVLLATNFYMHFGLNNADFSEYDTDIMLEYDDSETYNEFKEFFYDVLSEFEKFGRIVQFKSTSYFYSVYSLGTCTGMHKVCNNYEKHLRGNTYVEFSELRCAVAAYRALHTRWYGGKQLSLQFCNISSWKNAICGLQLRRRCPKGRACNFLHVFRNPNNLFRVYDTGQSGREQDTTRRRSPRSWRWSESPEVEITKVKSRRSSRSDESERRRKDREERHKKQSRRSPKARRTSSRRSSKER